MDGELLATDTSRFATLKKLVDIDLADRREWFGRAEKNRAERFKRTNTKKPVYEGAPNLVDPIIDDLVREHDRDARPRVREGVLPVDLQHGGHGAG
jgi:hypothetical protein